MQIMNDEAIIHTNTDSQIAELVFSATIIPCFREIVLADIE